MAETQKSEFVVEYAAMKSVRSLFALLLLASTAGAQEGPVFKLNVNVDLVEIHVTVLDDGEHPVGGLQKDNFKLTENHVAQSISVFKHEDIPVSLGLVIDNSRSIEPRKQRLDAAALSFVRKGNPEDETFIVHFDDTARLARDFTDSIPDLEDTLAAVKPFGQTAIYDALILALDHMRNAKQRKKTVLLITDGVDNVSTHSFEDAVEKVRREQVAVYTVGLLSQAGGLKAEAALIKLAEASGGRAYFPQTAEEARTTMERIARDLREQYTLGYFPTDPNRDGAWRSVRVEVIPPIGLPPKLVANYRHGYYGPDR